MKEKEYKSCGQSTEVNWVQYEDRKNGNEICGQNLEADFV